MVQPPPATPKFNHQTLHSNPDPAGTGDTVVVPIPPGTELLALQIQAFLRASQDEELEGDVVFDEEVVKDILDVLSGSGSGSVVGLELQDRMDDDSDDEYLCAEDAVHYEKALMGSAAGTVQKGRVLRDNHTVPQDLRVGSPWQKQEIRAMMHLLKERGPAEFISEYVHTQSIPIPKLLEALGVSLCPELWNRKPKTMLYFLQVAMAHARWKRDKLARYNTIDDAVKLINQSNRILVLTGAGISVSCGIPDFRSRDGLYASLKDKGEYELDDPQQMFDIEYFRENPAGNQIYPSNFEPSPCHRFIRLVEDKGKLLRNYTQNIDTLEMRAGVRKVLQCHGSFATASCLNCKRKVPGKEIEREVLEGKVPLCAVCNVVAITQPKKGAGKRSKKKKRGEWDSDCEDESDGPDYPPGVMKPDITFFGEKLSDEFDRCLAEDRFKIDLLLVIGTSLNVSPVAEILSRLPHSIPQILINKTPVRHITPDIILLGNADDIVTHLSERLGWELPPRSTQTRPQKQTALGGHSSSRSHLLNSNLKRLAEDDAVDQLRRVPDPQRVGESHVWLFDGAEGGKWLQQLQSELDVGDSEIEESSRSSTPNGRQGRADDERREMKKRRVI